MALLESCRNEIVDFNGFQLLLEFLNEKPSNYIEHPINYLNGGTYDTVESEISACERVQQKAAIAVSRFCKDPKYTSQLIDYGGFKHYLFIFYANILNVLYTFFVFVL